MDLDDEELEATRKLNGVVKKSNIEEDIKYIKECLKIARVFFKSIKAETDYKEIDDVAFCIAIDNILAERKQDKARIQELEEEKKVMCEEYCPKTERIKELEEENKSKQKAYDDCYCEYKYYKQFDSIPKQKVKDLIENETINVSGFKCIAVEDLEKLLEDN